MKKPIIRRLIAADCRSLTLFKPGIAGGGTASEEMHRRGKEESKQASKLLPPPLYQAWTQKPFHFVARNAFGAVFAVVVVVVAVAVFEELLLPRVLAGWLNE